MASKVKIRINDEANAVVLGLSDEHQEYFYDKYAVPAPNYFFNPKYKLGQWDGKIRFFHKTGKTFLYLLEDIIPRIAKLGYKLELEDLRTTILQTPQPIDNQYFAHVQHVETKAPTILRPHQVEAINAATTYGNGVIIAATGAGKTLITAALCDIYGKLGMKTITIVPNQDLISQTKADFSHYGLDVGEYSGKEKTLDHQHIVSTWQALKNNPKILLMFQVVVVDECHGLKGNVLTKLLVEHSAKIPYRFGVTGTLPKEKSDKMAVHVAVGPVRYEVDAAYLIDKKILASLNISILQLEEDFRTEYETFCRDHEAWVNSLTERERILAKDQGTDKVPTYIQFKDQYFTDFEAEKTYLHHKEDRLETIAQFIEQKRDMKKGNVLCLVDRIDFARRLAALIPDAILVNGKDIKQKDRKSVYKMFEDNDNLIVIATVHIAGTGLNIPRIFNLMIVDIGKSFIRVIQGIGRGLRLAEDKTHLNVTDICSDLKYSKRHVAERIRYYKEAKYPHKKSKIDYSAHSKAVATVEQ